MPLDDEGNEVDYIYDDEDAEQDYGGESDGWIEPFQDDEQQAEGQELKEENIVAQEQEFVIEAVFGERVADELFDGRRGKVFDDGHRREYIRRFRVVVKTNRVNAELVCLCPGLPEPWSMYFPPGPVDVNGNALPYITDVKAICIGLEAEPEHKDDWQSWIVTARYGSHPSQLKPNVNARASRWFSAANRPDYQRPKLSWSTESHQVAATKDLAGDWFINSAMQPFSPPYMLDLLVPVLTIVRYQSKITQETINHYAFAVNDAPFLGAHVDQAQIFSISATEEYLGDEVWYKTEIKIRFAPSDQNPDGSYIFSWQPRLLDAGLMELVKWDGVPHPVPPDLGKPRTILGPGGHPISSPVLLDGDGSQGKPKPPGDPDEGTIVPYYIEFYARRRVKFSDLFTYGLNYYGGAMILPFVP
jgi:hypothetical protein